MGSVGGIEFETLYDEATRRRIERAPRPTLSRSVPPRRLGGTALAAAFLLGLRDVIEPARRIEIVEVDPWSGDDDGTGSRVRLRWSADPARTVALVSHRHR